MTPEKNYPREWECALPPGARGLQSDFSACGIDLLRTEDQMLM